MAVVPLRQRITYEHPTGAYARDGTPILAPPVEMMAAVYEETKVVVDKNGKDVVTGLTVTLDKLANAAIDGRITYTDEIGRTKVTRIVNIEPLRLPGGRVLQTEVYAR